MLCLEHSVGKIWTELQIKGWFFKLASEIYLQYLQLLQYPIAISKIWNYDPPTHSLTDWDGRMSFLMELFNFQNNFQIFPTRSEPTCSCGNCFLPLHPCMPPSFLPEQNRNEGAFTVNNDNITRPSKIEIYHRDHWINTVPIWICFYWIYSFISIVLLDL